jgi:hypothetical protein
LRRAIDDNASVASCHVTLQSMGAAFRKYDTWSGPRKWASAHESLALENCRSRVFRCLTRHPTN